jgi:hypothetical protein
MVTASPGGSVARTVEALSRDVARSRRQFTERQAA